MHMYMHTYSLKEVILFGLYCSPTRATALPYKNLSARCWTASFELLVKRVQETPNSTDMALGCLPELEDKPTAEDTTHFGHRTGGTELALTWKSLP